MNFNWRDYQKSRRSLEREIASEILMMGEVVLPPALEKLVENLRAIIRLESKYVHHGAQVQFRIGFLLLFPRLAFGQWIERRRVRRLLAQMPSLAKPVKPVPYGTSGWTQRQCARYAEFCRAHGVTP